MKFIINNYYIVLYAIALALSMVRYHRYFDSLLKYFPVIIGYTLLTEILGILIRDIEDLQIVYLEGYSFYNLFIYNIFEVIFFLYFFFVFRNAVANSKFKKLIGYGSILFIVGSVINPFFQNIMLYPQMLAYSFGSIILISCIIMYFAELRKKSRTHNHHNLLFWISLGLLIFYSLYPFILLIGYFNYELYLVWHMRQIHLMLIAAMYLCFILGFVFMRRVRQKEV